MATATTTKLFKIVGWTVVGALALGAAGAAALAIWARSVGVPPDLGVIDGRLKACPDSPNCVSTQAEPLDGARYLPPVPMGQPASIAQERVRQILDAEPRAEVLRDEPGYLHAVFRSPIMGFPDDVEIYFDEPAGLIHFRSASRLGRSDLGVNYARMERLSLRFAEAVAR
jgi:uncharacterized protein (DUF1499 family)